MKTLFTLLLSGSLLCGCAQGNTNQSTKIPGELNAQETQALMTALEDEYKAFATYEVVIEDFGQQRPFTNIIKAEAQHISSLEKVMKKYALEIPENNWKEEVEHYSSLQEACEVGVAAEITNAALYDELLLMTDKEDILQVFKRLQSASQDNHLPAFQRCAKQ